MLHELRVENLLLLERAELRLGPGLNALTGETGAGKTLLAQALDLLLGGRAGAGIVRPGASEAYVEGVFEVPAGLAGERVEQLPGGAEEIVLARRVWPDGRTRAYVCGRSATVADLRELGSQLLSFYGQHEHRKLMLSAAQMELLDSHCGAAHRVTLTKLAEAYRRLRELEAHERELGELAGARDRELDLLTFEIEEIEAADPSEEEQEALVLERDRLRHLELLRAAAATGAEAISPDAGTGAAELVARTVAALEPAAAIDPSLAALCERLASLRYELDDAAGELRRYEFGVEGAPGRLEEVEERLALIGRLERKHGGSIAAVLAHAELSRARRAELEHAESALEEVECELAAARAELEGLAAEIGEARRRAAPQLAGLVRERLAELAMPDAEFEVVVQDRSEGCGPRGAETVELFITPNPGVPAGPLREIASGGELSRVMLAVLSVAHEGPTPEGQPVLVFDEIDAGIGGHTARVVGERLSALADGRQILCITHLPQVASLADKHFEIAKTTNGASATTTLVRELSGEDVVGELVRMLGAKHGDRAASEHARQLLRAA